MGDLQGTFGQEAHHRFAVTGGTPEIVDGGAILPGGFTRFEEKGFIRLLAHQDGFRRFCPQGGGPHGSHDDTGLIDTAVFFIQSDKGGDIDDVAVLGLADSQVDVAGPLSVLGDRHPHLGEDLIDPGIRKTGPFEKVVQGDLSFPSTAIEYGSGAIGD